MSSSPGFQRSGKIGMPKAIHPRDLQSNNYARFHRSSETNLGTMYSISCFIIIITIGKRKSPCPGNTARLDQHSSCRVHRSSGMMRQWAFLVAYDEYEVLRPAVLDNQRLEYVQHISSPHFTARNVLRDSMYCTIIVHPLYTTQVNIRLQM
jgi:hypothetical protein